MLLFISSGLFHSMAMAGDITAGEKKASFCIQCHGMSGVADNLDVPIIAGQNEGYLAAQLRSFRDGTRRSTPMRLVTQNLSDEDIADLAAYYSSLKGLAPD